MQKVRLAKQLIRVLGLTLLVWPFTAGGDRSERAKEVSFEFPSVARCQAARAAGGILTWDGSRCVAGDGGCNFKVN